MLNKNSIGWLRVARSVGSKTFHSIRSKYKDPEEAAEYLKRINKQVTDEAKVLEEIHKTEKYGAQIISIDDPRYPKLLREICDAPAFLIVKGELDPDSYCISIIGSRNSSLSGNKIGFSLAERLVECGYCIVSGLARGIDRHAHLGGIKKTIGVIGCGIDHVYPRDNQDLYNKITETGVIVTEFPIGTPPSPGLFHARNRIIAGISIATVVVQAASHSGSLVTAQYAIDYNRDVFAVPGCPLDSRSYGTNRLIKNGAPLVQDHNDILQQLSRFNLDPLIKANANNLSSEISESIEVIEQIDNHTEYDEKYRILSSLSSTPVKIDDLCDQLFIPISKVRQILIELELLGQARYIPGDRVVKDG